MKHLNKPPLQEILKENVAFMSVVCNRTDKC